MLFTQKVSDRNIDITSRIIDLRVDNIDYVINTLRKKEFDEVLTKFDNKVFNKRFETALREVSNYIRESKDSDGIVIPSYKVKAIDTTGAGDSFCSGFLSAYAKGKSFLECAQFANATGAHNVMAKGATTGIKSFDEIMQFIEDKTK